MKLNYLHLKFIAFTYLEHPPFDCNQFLKLNFNKIYIYIYVLSVGSIGSTGNRSGIRFDQAFKLSPELKLK